ncbi:acyl CoA:acetate/3-ketoacid CoA transferase [Clostridium pasteurianum DSM 525 = ATCC 6013]|uniref:Acyl CoA:acetate/3-ketoacid CoA transferase n=1 Tax=Clostridium pasteurianum DSM 525 = ATCC 6013 TaxID=1262449 RepID=A0A0H3J9J8_CLOPA|nr:acyl CoA:acetate/3-ketoacid CoA transferase [Clostridium pasteurianum]AJA50027.1 acyl CoA:acetate/3-ketoacid CoA transferase [Clostridium pasteurianum DSM 525 = ATCC 6013]AJA54015.1 acyl CoA:acetate/3-ketoacid CoA transferase [Clostridium pasteurianum DSM 525 = ATCC 6013]AOZ77157.1 CoA-transferase [Clostridium pasteurianum DSM 525 = ATCC 6013]AOZ80954.1 CoA-transferase [Clostridium pasteurianum]ELP59264.1 coenzyme A transferase [Clostridium pasteurianum DSM 525 = ATCC 6013]
MKSKIMSKDKVIHLIKDGDTVAVGGFVGCAHPEDITSEIEKSYLKEHMPKNLTLIFAAGQGDGGNRGLNHFGHEGLVDKVIGGHWALAPKLQKLALDNKIEAYNLPQGIISQLYRDIAAKRPGTVTHVGLKTFVDPRIEGGKLNEITKKDLIDLINIEGKKYLFYKSMPIDVVILRATYADEFGNATMEKEAATLDATAMAQAAKNSGGIVIIQVEEVVSKGSLDPKKVKIPGIYVDAIVIAKPENHMQTFSEHYNPSYSGEAKFLVNSISNMPLNERKIIARRATMELSPNSVINLGIGIPEGIAIVANEEGIADEMTLTIESGGIGGVPSGGLSFGASTNPESILDQSSQFDFYDGGGLNVAFLGLAQCDKSGNINVSKFGPKIAGCGGFINISQNSKKVVYCGTFTAGGLKIKIKDGNLIIEQDGKFNKFINTVEQISFSGEYAADTGQKVLYITERAVFRLDKKELVLEEIAPGIDLKKDILDHMDFMPKISNNLKIMDERIFKERPMGIKIKD